jgi:hypothetical protein
MKPPPPVDLELRCSRPALAAVIALHAAAAALLLALPLPPEVCAAGGIGIVLAGALAVQSVAGGTAVVRLSVGLDRRITVTRRDGRTLAGTVLGDSYVDALLTTIVWRPDGGLLTRTLFVVPGSLPSADFRRLRVVLRYGLPPP